MLKKENRLKSSSAFSATYKNRNTVSNDYMILYAGKNKLDKNCPTRVGFVVSKKVSKRAVKRNKIKRLMREKVRQMFLDNDSLNLLNAYQSLILSAKPKIIELENKEISNIILTLFDMLANKNI